MVYELCVGDGGPITYCTHGARELKGSHDMICQILACLVEMLGCGETT